MQMNIFHVSVFIMECANKYMHGAALVKQMKLELFF